MALTITRIQIGHNYKGGSLIAPLLTDTLNHPFLPVHAQYHARVLFYPNEAPPRGNYPLRIVAYISASKVLVGNLPPYQGEAKTVSDMSATDDTVSIQDVVGYANFNGFILVDSEVMYVSRMQGNILTIYSKMQGSTMVLQRGMCGTTVAAHPAGSRVQILSNWTGNSPGYVINPYQVDAVRVVGEVQVSATCQGETGPTVNLEAEHSEDGGASFQPAKALTLGEGGTVPLTAIPINVIVPLQWQFGGDSVEPPQSDVVLALKTPECQSACQTGSCESGCEHGSCQTNCELGACQAACDSNPCQGGDDITPCGIQPCQTASCQAASCTTACMIRPCQTACLLTPCQSSCAAHPCQTTCETHGDTPSVVYKCMSEYVYGDLSAIPNPPTHPPSGHSSNLCRRFCEQNPTTFGYVLYNGHLLYFAQGDSHATADACANSGCPLGAVAPAAPQSVSASDGTYTDKCRVTWTHGNWNGQDGNWDNATGFNIYRGATNDIDDATLIAENVSESPYDDTTGDAGTTYYYWVKAVFAGVESAASTPDTGSKQAPLPFMRVTQCGNSAYNGDYFDYGRTFNGVTLWELPDFTKAIWAVHPGDGSWNISGMNPTTHEPNGAQAYYTWDWRWGTDLVNGDWHSYSPGGGVDPVPHIVYHAA